MLTGGAPGSAQSRLTAWGEWALPGRVSYASTLHLCPGTYRGGTGYLRLPERRKHHAPLLPSQHKPSDVAADRRIYVLGMLSGWTVVGFLRRSWRHAVERPQK